MPTSLKVNSSNSILSMDKHASQNLENENLIPKTIQFSQKNENYFSSNMLAQKQIQYDNVNQKYIGLIKGAQKNPDIKYNNTPLVIGSISDANNSSFLFEQFDSDGKLICQDDITETVCCTKIDIQSDISSNSSSNFINNRYENTQYQRHQVESKLQNTPNSQGFEDSMSILRFKNILHQNSSSSAQVLSNSVIGVSNCGLEVTVLKQKKNKSSNEKGKDTKQNEQNANDPQLVLTNMSLSQGVHVWEIICPISCQDIWVGVYSPLSQQSVMETFYNTTPRSIFICLDLNKGQINFWLNEHKVQNKVLKLFHQPGQQWIPAIKICRERNKVILNPFPNLPGDFQEDFPLKNFDQTRYYIPYLVNTICVTGLPELSTISKKAVDQLKNYLQLSNNQLSKITLFKMEGNKPLPENQMLCFLKFHNHELMSDFIEYHKSHQGQIISIKVQDRKQSKLDNHDNDEQNLAQSKSQEAKQVFQAETSENKNQIAQDNEKKEAPKFKIEILEPHQIISLLQMLNKTDTESVQKTEKLKIPLKLLLKEMYIPEESNINETQKAIENAFNHLKQLKNHNDLNNERQALIQQNAVFEELTMIHQPFTDNTICIKNQQALKLIHRSPQTLGSISVNHSSRFNEPPRTLDGTISLKILYKVIPSFFKFMCWQTMINKNETSNLLLGVTKKIFEDIISNSQYIQSESQENENLSYVQFLVNLVDIKYFIDLAICHTKLAIKKQSRTLQGDSLIQELQQAQLKNGIKQEIKNIKLLEFQNQNLPSIEELYIVLNILIDLDEQIWIQTRSNQCSADVKNFMNTISRPFSALNRLGSFVSFGVSKIQDYSQKQIPLKDSPQILSDIGYFYKQSSQICLSNSGNSKAKIDCLNFCQIQENKFQMKHFGQDNRLLNNLITDNIELHKSLNYQVAELSSQQIFDVIVSQNSQFVLIAKTNGVVHLHSSLIGLCDLKQIIMFKNEGKKANKTFMETVKKLQQKEKDSLKFNQQILSKSAEIKLFQDLQNVSSKQSKAEGEPNDLNSKANQKAQKKSEKKKQTTSAGTLAKSGTILDIHQYFTMNKQKNQINEKEPSKQLKFENKNNVEKYQQLLVQEDIDQVFFVHPPLLYHDQKIFQNFKFSSNTEKEQSNQISKTENNNDQTNQIISEIQQINALNENGSKQKDEDKTQDEPKQTENFEEQKKEIIDESQDQKDELKFEVSQCSIYGYFMLTEPAHKKSFDPIIIGCIFKYLPSNKVYIRVKKLAFKLNYITQFIELDPETGYYIDKISNLKMFKNHQQNQDQDIMHILQGVIQQHQENIIDLNAIFLRSLASKSQGQSKSKLDSRFQIFQYVCEQDIEITNCLNVIDFTKCSYSIQQQDAIYILMEQKDSQNQVQTVIQKYMFNKEGSESSSFQIKVNNYQIFPQEIQMQTELNSAQLNKSSKDKFNLKLFICESNLILVNQSQVYILNSVDGKVIKKVEFGEGGCDIKTLNIINKSKQSNQYWKYNMNPLEKQEWHLVYQPIIRSSNDLCQISLFSSDTQKGIANASQLKQDLIRDVSQDELNMAILSLKDMQLKFTVNVSDKQSDQFLHFASCDSNQYSITSLDSFGSNTQKSLLRIQLIPEKENLKSLQIRKIQVSINVKVDDFTKFKNSIAQNKSIDQKQKKIESKEKNEKIMNLPLVVEQWKGAQTNDSHLPSIITTNNKSVFCSNYPEPEYTFRHFYDQQFIIKSFTIKSLFNRESWGMPVGKGYIFASDCLENISNTRKFINKLKLLNKEWEPKEYYVPEEPIGMFDLDKDVEATFQIEEKFQRPFRYIKLVPVGFRKAPINFSRIKFHSKRAEIMYFGISGVSISNSIYQSISNEVDLDLQQNIKDIETQNQFTFSNQFQGIQLHIEQQGQDDIKIDTQDDIVLNKYLIDNTNASAQINKMVQIQQNQSLDKNNLSLQPVLKINQSFKISQDLNIDKNQNIILKIDQDNLQQQGLQFSSLHIQILGSQKNFENEKVQNIHELMSDPQKFFNDFFKPLVASLNSSQIIKDDSPVLYHFKLVSELLNSWIGEYKQVNKFIQFITIVQDQLLEDLLSSSLQIHKVDQMQILNFIKIGFFNQVIHQKLSELDPIIQKGRLKIFTFVQQVQKDFIKQRQRKSTIEYILKLQKLLVQKSVEEHQVFQQALIQDQMHLLNNEICNNQLLKNSDQFQIQRLIKKNYDISTEDILDGIPVNLDQDEKCNLKRMYRDDLLLDFEKMGNSLLITNQLTEVYKVNNFYHFNIDFKGAVRANILKLVFNEKNTKKQLTFKVQIIISVPDLSLCDKNQLEGEINEKLPLKVIYQQIFNENQVSQANQVAFKKSSQDYEQGSSLNKLIIDFQSNSLENGFGGIVTRYMTIQVQLLETMKSQKDSSFMVNNFLFIPQIFGFKSSLNLPLLPQYEIIKPQSDKNSVAKTFIGLDKNPIYNINEIQGLIKEFTNKKCALLSIFDNSNQIQSKDQLEKVKSKINGLRTQLRKKIVEKKDQKEIQQQVDKIMALKMKHSCNFAADENNLSYDYLINLREQICNQLLIFFESTPKLVSDDYAQNETYQNLFKSLFLNLLNCMALEETKQPSKPKSSTFKNGQKLIKYVFNQFLKDNQSFYFEIILNNLIGAQSDLLQREQKELVSNFLQENAPNDFNQIIQSYISNFQCDLSQFEQKNDHIQKAIMMINGKNSDNYKLQKNANLKPRYFQIFLETIGISKFIAEKTNIQINPILLIKLLSYHLTHCKKIKFERLLETKQMREDYEKSIIRTNSLIIVGLKVIAESVEAIKQIDLSQVMNEITILILSSILISDQEERKNALNYLSQISKADKIGIIPLIIIQFVEDPQTFYHISDSVSSNMLEYQKNDVLDLMEINSQFVANFLQSLQIEFPNEFDSLQESLLVLSKDIIQKSQIILQNIFFKNHDLSSLEKNSQQNDQQLKLFEISFQISQSAQVLQEINKDVSGEVENNQIGLLYQFNQAFLGINNYSEQKKQMIEGAQLMIYPKIVVFLQQQILKSKSLSSLKKKNQEDNRQRVICQCLIVLDSILNSNSNNANHQLSEVQFGYAHSILSILQSDGEKLEQTEIPSLKIEDLEQQSPNEKQKLTKQLIQVKLNKLNTIQLMKTFSTYIVQMLGMTNFGGVAGASRTLIFKLELANQIASILDLASASSQFQDLSNYQVSGFQYVLQDENGSENFAKSWIKNIINWLFSQRDPSQSKVQNQPSIVQAKKLRFQILSILSKTCIAVEEISDQIQIKKINEYRIRGLNISLECLILCIQSNEKSLRDQLKNNGISLSQAFKIQENTNNLLMFLFRKWVQDDLTAQNFLREHDGLNFMLNRLFQNNNQQEKYSIVPSDIQLEDLDISSDDSEEISKPIKIVKKEKELKIQAIKEIHHSPKQKQIFTDKKSPSSIFKEIINIKKQSLKQFKQQDDKIVDLYSKLKYKVCKKWLMGQCKNGDKCMFNHQKLQDSFQEEIKVQEVSEIAQQVKEQELVSQMRVIYTSEKQEMAESAYKTLNLADYKCQENMKILVVPSQFLQQEFNMILEVQNNQTVQINEICLGLYFKFSTYEKDMSYLPLIVVAQGGMKHSKGTVEEVKWNVALTPKFDQGTFMNNVWCFGIDLNNINFSSGLQKSFEAKYIRISLRYPITALLEQSSFYSQLHKPMNYTIQFLSCVGSLTANEKIQDAFTDIQKDSSLVMLSQFFQGKFLETFKTISSEPGIIMKIKDAFKRIEILLETKSQLIKPIFISLCQENDELCDWVIGQQILNKNIDEIKTANVLFLAELINSQRLPASYIKKIKAIKDYLFQQIQLTIQGNLNLKDIEHQKIILKLIGILVRSAKNLKNKFKILELNEIIPFSKNDFQSLLQFKAIQMKQFEGNNEIQGKIQKAVHKLFGLIFGDCQDENKISNQIDILEASDIIIQNEVNRILNINKDAKIDWKKYLPSFQNIDIISLFAAFSGDVFKKIQNLEIKNNQSQDDQIINDQGSKYDIISIIIEKLLENQQQIADDQIQQEQNKEEKQILPTIIKQSLKNQVDPSQIVDIDKIFVQNMSQANEDDKNINDNIQLVQVLRNLSFNPKFQEFYGGKGQLSVQLYQKTLKNQSHLHKYALMLNPCLDEESIQILLKIMVQILLTPTRYSDGKSIYLEQIGKLLKEDLNQASQKEDISFIKQIIVPLLHAEDKASISISLAIANQDGQKIKTLKQFYENNQNDIKFFDQQKANQIETKTENIVQSKQNNNKQNQQLYFLKTDLLTDKMKETLEKKFVQLRKDKMPEVQQMIKCEWKKLYSHKKGEKDDVNAVYNNYYWNQSGFKEMMEACEGKNNLMILIKGKQGVNHQGLVNNSNSNNNIVIGSFFASQFPANMVQNWQHEFDYAIEYNQNNFAFVYSVEGKMSHYEQKMQDHRPFAFLYTDCEFGGALNLMSDFMMISWSQDFSHTFGNQICSQSLDEDAFVGPFEFTPLEIQVWHYQPGFKPLQQSKGNPIKKLKGLPTFQKDSPINYFSNNLIFQENINKDLNGILNQYIPEEFHNNYNLINQQEFQNSIINNQPKTLKDYIIMKHEKAENQILGNQVIDFSLQIFHDRRNENLQQLKEQVNEEIVPQFPILKNFEKEKGIYDLISVAIAVVKTYQSKTSKEIWILWLNELQSFSGLPNFFDYFSKDLEKAQTIYKLIGRSYDIDPLIGQSESEKLSKEYDKLCTEHVKYTYKTIDEIFKNHSDSKLREYCIQNGIFSKFLHRLSCLTGEKKRHKKTVPEHGEIKSDDQIKIVSVKPIQNPGKTNVQDNQKKKGVGYTTGVGSAWNVQEYLDSKEVKNQQISTIINIIKHSINDSLQAVKIEQSSLIDEVQENIPTSIQKQNDQFKDLLLESAILPILEQAMRSGSLLEMAKETDLFNSYLGLIYEIAKNKDLNSLLQDIGENYLPEQKASVQDLLEKVSKQSQIFLGCLQSKEQISDKKSLSKEDEDSKKLAENIIETNKIVNENLKVNNIIENSQIVSIEQIDNLPLAEAYKQLLQPLRFDYITMKKNPSDKTHLHKYDEDAQAELVPSQSKIIRLAQEVSDLSNSLPCDPTNAMFCRVAKSRIDLMKVLIMGAAGTPYAHGAFFYDLFFPSNYPQAPPKTLLTTTGGGTVRFNPNLYNQGKVCLSLLGTWRGSSTEMWDPKLSTILQLVLSIQAIIMSNEVYFNEPGYEHEMNTVEGEKKNRGYQNIVKYCNVKFAIIENIKSPPKGFEKIIKRNYYLKKQMILDEVKQWCEESKDSDTSATYSGLVYDHNYLWAPQISKPGAYKTMMDEIYIELEKTLNSIPHPMEDKDEEGQDQNIVENKTASLKEQGIFLMDFEDLNQINVSYQQTEQKENQENDENNQIMKMDILDEKVKDRWSRYIGAMGIEAVAKQAESRILICDLGALGIEIAKNIVLAGCKELVIFERPQDKQASSFQIASGQFFLSEDDPQLSIALQCKHKLQQLNHYVKVTVIKDQKYPTVLDYLKDQKKNNQEAFRVVVHTENYYAYELQGRLDEVLQCSKFCRLENIPFIWAYVSGCSARIFNDFGQKFQVVESSSEEISDVIIQSITKFEDNNQEKSLALITLMEGFKNQYQEGDMVCIQKVVAPKSSIVPISNEDNQINSSSKNDSLDPNQQVAFQFQVKKVINTQKFLVEMNENQIKEFSGEQECIAKYLKTSKTVEFKSLEEYFNMYADYIKDSLNEGDDRFNMEKIEEVQNKAGFFDENLIWADFEKLQEIRLTDFVITSRLDLENFSDSGSFEEQSDLLMSLLQGIKEKEVKKKFLDCLFKITLMYNESVSCLPPMCAFIGGVVSQEIIKAVTQKFMPIKQVAIFSCSELIEESSWDYEESDFNDNRMLIDEMMDEVESRIYSSVTDNQGYSQRDISQIILLGINLHEKIKQCKLFMVGSGAIGCELLKNYAMLGIGTGKDGHIILTDPDVIEVSNLNRQFLFREQHLRKPKSSTAAAAAIQMNQELKGHIFARLDKIHDGTQDIYTEEFYENQTIITNALDNVQARLYLDKKCVQARVPMIDSGTLGPKGHVQVVIPYQTESYSSQKDPDVNAEIPHCTLKMFPEETLHCVEWAKDLFGNWFTLDPQSYNKFVFSQEDQDYSDTQVQQTAKKIIKLEKKRPLTFEDCLIKARKKFHRLFSNQILQLIHTYPIDKLNKDGRPFWSLPKRPPRKIDFDPQNMLHASFIASCACLFAVMYKIDIKKEQNAQFFDNEFNLRSDSSKLKMAQWASQILVKPFVPNDQKSKEIENDVEKQNKKEEQSDQAAEPTQIQSSLIEEIKDNEEIKKAKDFINNIQQSLKSKQQKEGDLYLQVEEFEKDNDGNFHIDFIYSMANIRASNYSLTPMDWITVKIKAGKIVPALATTTAAVAALQTIELLKVLKGLPIGSHRNSFLNLAVPSLMMGEPGAPQKFKITEDLAVSLWDRWEFKATQSSTMIDVINNLEQKVHKGALEFRDIFQGATPIFLYSFGQTLAKTQNLKSILDCEVLNKSLIEILGLDKQKLPKFVDLTITFSLASENKDKQQSAYEILKNVPDVRVYFK